MSKQRINRLIPKALEEVVVFVDSNGGVQSRYMASVAAFGASMLQSGIYATELFYRAKGDGDPRSKIPAIIAKMLGREKFTDCGKEEILDAATALKLAIRTYKKVDNDTSDAAQEVQDE